MTMLFYKRYNNWIQLLQLLWKIYLHKFQKERENSFNIQIQLNILLWTVVLSALTYLPRDREPRLSLKVSSDHRPMLDVHATNGEYLEKSLSIFQFVRVVFIKVNPQLNKYKEEGTIYFPLTLIVLSEWICLCFYRHVLQLYHFSYWIVINNKHRWHVRCVIWHYKNVKCQSVFQCVFETQ